jgi:TonB family protein
VRFQYPEYLNNIVNEIFKRWANPIRGVSRLRAEVSFTIQRDGTVTDIQVTRKSGVTQFDFAAQGAITKAGREQAFGALPSGFNGESLPIVFSFTPRTP